MNAALKLPTPLMFYYSHSTCYFYYLDSDWLFCVVKCLIKTCNTCYAQKCHGVHMLKIVMLLLETTCSRSLQAPDDSTSSLENDE